jgi:predicted RNA-binding Zn ribbon-like protein
MTAASPSSGKADTVKSLALDFANTVDWHAGPRPRETLRNYADLIAWAFRRGLLDNPSVRSLARRARSRPARAAAVLVEAKAWREALYRIFTAAVHGREPRAADVEIFNRAWARRVSRFRIMRDRGRFVRTWDDSLDPLARALGEILCSAADLLTSDAIERVGQCADDRGCGWLFFDVSRNKSRRWCDMKDCGNRAKAKRHYDRSKKE